MKGFKIVKNSKHMKEQPFKIYIYLNGNPFSLVVKYEVQVKITDLNFG